LAPGRCGACAAGFTLIEMVLVVLLVGILMSLLLPALGRTRDHAQAIMSVSQLRGHGQIMHMYAGDWDDAWPWFADPKATKTVIRCQERETSIEIWYFQSGNTWNYALADGYYEGNFDDESFYPPGMPEGEATFGFRGGPTPYAYGCAFIARPEYWRPESRTGPNQWGYTRASEVVYPAAKTLLISDWPMLKKIEREYNPLPPLAAIPLTTEMCFVDGSAELFPVASVNPGYETGDGVFQGGYTHPFDYPFTAHTIGGVRGRDR